ncbi:hypothetical protein PSTT_12650 [Puccinia striiformis]|uniref:Uncharacterized protein n=1 Tax=Puccinia striiformis TaxID=27350 RepID=A0A2S4UV33_9BASI|nr:hypothetical protein PSTT_12650 [Puccinia striiformis]
MLKERGFNFQAVIHTDEFFEMMLRRQTRRDRLGHPSQPLSNNTIQSRRDGTLAIHTCPTVLVYTRSSQRPEHPARWSVAVRTWREDFKNLGTDLATHRLTRRTGLGRASGGI